MLPTHNPKKFEKLKVSKSPFVNFYFDPIKGRIDPYCNGGQELRNKENCTNFSIEEQLEIDFNLHNILNRAFFDEIKMDQSDRDLFGLSVYENLLVKWNEDFDEIDELMLPFPFGRLYKQINDGRYEKIMKYLENIMTPQAYSILMGDVVEQFFKEFFIFLNKFDIFVERRNDEEYQMNECEDFVFFSEYCFKYNLWLEELSRNFLHLTLPHLKIYQNLGAQQENLVQVLVRLYEDYLNLGIEEDLTDLTSDNEVGFIQFYPSNGRKLMRKELFKVRFIYILPYIFLSSLPRLGDTII